MNLLFSAFLISCDSNLIESNVYDSDEKSSLCDISIVETIPFPDSTNAYYRSPITVVLSDVDPEASITVSTSETVVSEKSFAKKVPLSFSQKSHSCRAHNTKFPYRIVEVKNLRRSIFLHLRWVLHSMGEQRFWKRDHMLSISAKEQSLSRWVLVIFYKLCLTISS